MIEPCFDGEYVRRYNEIADGSAALLRMQLIEGQHYLPLGQAKALGKRLGIREGYVRPGIG